MTPIPLESLGAPSAQPALIVTLVAAALGAAWGLHIWRLRRRERRLALLVDERTRLWQEEAAAHARLRGLVEAGATAGETGTDAIARAARVLVVGERRERREAMNAIFDELGIAPVFADSRWAATVATREADAGGTPYDLILVDESMEGSAAGAASPPPSHTDGPFGAHCSAAGSMGGPNGRAVTEERPGAV